MIEIEPEEVAPTPDAYTRTGLGIWYWNPERTRVDHDEVLTVLAEQYRYSGHFPVSILFHSWVVAEIASLLGADPATVGYAGVHDCHEAFSQDLPRGLKGLIRDYPAIEAGWEAHVHAAFGYRRPSPAIAGFVRRADRLAVPVELRLVGIELDHPLYEAAVAEIGDPGLVERLYLAVEEAAGSMSLTDGVPDAAAIAARWQQLTCPNLPPLRLLSVGALASTPTLAARVIQRQRAELLEWRAAYPAGLPASPTSSSVGVSHAVR